ncbi:MAG TPA: LamG domain-containing protein [Myxococcota bacterium]|nr:LamG domain-containing protein [Myxococcota bacterium]
MTIRHAVSLSLLLAALAATGCGGSGGGNDGRAVGAAPTNAGSGGSGTGGSGFGVGVPGGGGAAGQAIFATTVYPITRQYCVQCHAGSGPGFPHIAHPDVETAFRAVVDNQKVKLQDPARSRLVRRLADDLHFCWSNCQQNADQMQAAIQAWADVVMVAAPPDPNDPNAINPTGVIASQGRSFLNATIAASGRYEDNMIARWKFEEGTGSIAADTAPVGPTMNLTLDGTYEWVSGGGVAFDGGRAMSNPTDSKKLFNEIASGSGTQEYSIEAWVIPENTTQGENDPARIVTYSNGPDHRNFLMGQSLYKYVFANRNQTPVKDKAMSKANGEPALVTSDGDQDLQANLQHAVMTYDQQHGRRIYVNGVDTDDPEVLAPSLLLNWDPNYTFAIARETTNNRTWRGTVKSVSIYRVALTPGQIQQNFEAGSSQRFTLRFGLDSTLGSGAWVEFTVSEFDAYSYLFCAPTLETNGRTGFSVQTIRIAVNGVAPVASQSFRTIDMPITASRTQLSTQCQVVPKDLGADQDTFHIFFDVLGNESMPIADIGANPPPPPGPAEAFPGIGIRDFAEINDTMGQLTGVGVTNPTVNGTYQELLQQLPGSSDVRTFVSAQQVGIARLSLEYCDQMVENNGLRTAMFGSSFPFTEPATTAFDTQAERDMIINPLVDKMLGTSLTNQPNQTDVRPVLNTLLDQLTAGCTAATCPATFTRNAVKGVCSAVLSSAAVQIH